MQAKKRFRHVSPSPTQTPTLAKPLDGENKKPIAGAMGFRCVPGRIRTSDLLIRSQPLYPAELRALVLDAFSKGPTNITEVLGARQGDRGNGSLGERSRFVRWLWGALLLRMSLCSDD